MSRPFDQALRNARRDQRYPVSFAADMLFGRRRLSVTVRDLSRNGAMLTGAELPPDGTRVLVTLGAAKLSGVVAWSHEIYCGLALLEPIEPLQIVRDMTRVQARRDAQADAPRTASARPLSGFPQSECSGLARWSAELRPTAS